MKNDIARVYIDVTQLTHWRGHLTGILRVMDEFAVRFERDYPNAEFIAWNAGLAMYCRVDFDDVTNWNAKSEEPFTLPASQQLVQRVKGKVARAVVKASPQLHATLKQGLQLARQRSNQQNAVHFKAGDSLFITWGEWGDKPFIAHLEEWHKEGLQIVQVIHDMGPIIVPQLSGSGNAAKTFSNYCRQVLPICSLVLVNSQFTKRAVVDWLHVNKLSVPTVEVFRLGEDFRITTSKKPKDPQFTRSKLRGQDFILFVGTVEIKKNHLLLYYVYKLAKSRGIVLPKLIIVGRPGWRTETVIELIREDPETKDDILLLQHSDDNDLSWLYDHCLFTVQASFYEGWGIPVAESLSRGVPAICSNSSSMVEIADGLVEYFSPASTDECLTAIQKLLDPKELVAAKKRAKKYRPFSWDNCFEQVKKYMEATR